MNEFPSDLILNPQGIHFYADEDGTYSFEGNFDFLSIDVSPFKQKTKSVFLRKGTHVVYFDPPTVEIVVKKNNESYGFSSPPPVDVSLDYVNVLPTPIEKQFSKYSDWIGDCAKKCGYDSHMKYREIIPELYVTGSQDPIGDLELSEDCNKMCYDDQSIFDKWKEVTRCPATSMPSSTKDKYFTTESGEKILSSLFIESLKYSEDPTELLSTWKASTNPLYSSECHGNSLIDGAMMNIGARIYSKDLVGFLEYRVDGSLVFACAGESDYVDKYVLRKAPADSSKVGSYIKFSDGVLQFMDNGFPKESIKVHTAACRLNINSYCILVVDLGDFIVNILGDTPSSLTLEGNTNYRFKVNAYDFDILKVDATRLTLTSTSKLKIYAGSSEVWSYNLPAGGQVMFGVNGIRSYDNALKESVILNATNIYKYSVSKEAIELYDSRDFLAAICGNPFSMLVNDLSIRRPTISEEIIPIKSGEGILQYKVDGNLVFYSKGTAMWSSGQTTSTHFKISVYGEILIMNESSIVYRSNFKVPVSTFAAIIVTESWCMICTQPAAVMEVNRVLPDISNMAAMRSVVERYMDSNRSKYPAYTLKANSHSITSNGFPVCVPDMSSYVDSQCSDGNVLCKYNKAQVVGSNKYKIDLNIGLTVPCVNYITGAQTLEYPYSNNVFEFNKCQILGYEPLFQEKYIGYFSTPIVNVMQKESTFLIRKDGTDFTDDFKNSDAFVNSFVSNNSMARIAMADILSTGDSLAMSSNFSFKKDLLSGFSNPVEEILNARKEMLELNCQSLEGQEFVDKCSELSYLSPEFYKGYVSESFANLSKDSELWLWIILILVVVSVVVYFWRKKNGKKPYEDKYKDQN